MSRSAQKDIKLIVFVVNVVIMIMLTKNLKIIKKQKIQSSCAVCWLLKSLLWLFAWEQYQDICNWIDMFTSGYTTVDRDRRKFYCANLDNIIT